MGVGSASGLGARGLCTRAAGKFPPISEAALITSGLQREKLRRSSGSPGPGRGEAGPLS